MKIINLKKKMKLLINDQQQSHENAKICYICEEKLENKYFKDYKNALQKIFVKLGIIVIIQENIEKLHLPYVI